jgi:hypothetical protein
LVKRCDARATQRVNAAATRSSWSVAWPLHLRGEVPMKAPNQLVALAAISVVALQLTACEAVKFVFKAGFWFGAIGVVALVLLIGFAVRAIRGGKA